MAEEKFYAVTPSGLDGPYPTIQAVRERWRVHHQVYGGSYDIVRQNDEPTDAGGGLWVYGVSPTDCTSGGEE